MDNITEKTKDISNGYFALLRKAYLAAKPCQQILSKMTEAFLIASTKNEDLMNLIPIEQFSNKLWSQTEGNEMHPPLKYRQDFIKKWIKMLHTLESQLTTLNSEVYQDILEKWYSALQNLSGDSSQVEEKFYRLYEITIPGEKPNKEFIKIIENENAFVAEGTTGLLTWEASHQLNEWLVSSNYLITSDIKWVLEIGCGCGFLAVATLKSSRCKCYVASDRSEVALNLCKENVALNIGGKIDESIFFTVKLDWFEDLDELKVTVEKLHEQYGPGCLLGADVIYDPTSTIPLTNVIKTFLSCQNFKGTVILCNVIRNEDTLRLFKSHVALNENTTYYHEKVDDLFVDSRAQWFELELLEAHIKRRGRLQKYYLFNT